MCICPPGAQWLTVLLATVNMRACAVATQSHRIIIYLPLLIQREAHGHVPEFIISIPIRINWATLLIVLARCTAIDCSFFFLFVWHLRMHTMLSIIFRNQQWATYCILSWTANKWMYLLSDSLQCRQATWQHKTSCSIINWAPGIDTKSERVYPHRAQIMMLLKVERPFLRKENYRSNLLFWLPLEIFRFFFHFIFNFKVKSRLLYV